jgi:myo-inositol-1(or 4)-monophosphatase
VAGRKRIGDAVVACALPHPSRGDVDLARNEHIAVQNKVAGLRRFGAAALDLAWVAAGRVDAYWERGLSPWDMAGGIALVREAGGFVTDLDGREDMIKTGGILAANEDIHRELLRTLKDAHKTMSTASPTPA